MKVVPLHRAYRCDVASPAASLLRERDFAAPRYASYPTPDRFVEAFDAGSYRHWLSRRRLGPVPPLALYVHLPFCAAACHHCACNMVVSRSYARAQDYLRHLEVEIAMIGQAIGMSHRVNQMHWGGGTPTYFRAEELAQLMRSLRGTFEFQPGGDFSIEIDPRTTAAPTIGLLADLGFNRLSIGMLDLDPEVQRAIRRDLSVERAASVLEAGRAAGFESINVDLIYGLPRQSVESYARTLEQVLAMRPERISMFSYVHRPERYRNQRRIPTIELPPAAEKIAIFSMAIERLNAAGYLHIGLDQFVLPADSLAIAQRAGRLHRSFHGYASQPEGDLIGIGASAISRIGAAYSQNHRAPADYVDAIAHGVLPVMRGIELKADDLVRRAVIMGLMSQGRVSIESIEIAHLIAFERYFAAELEELDEWVAAGLVGRDDEWIEVGERGRQYLCAIAACFDRHRRERAGRAMLADIL